MEFDYIKLTATISSLIDQGDYPPGSSIPSERDLCDKYNVSRTTVRKAIEDLVNKKILVKKPGKGTFVARKPEQVKGRTGNVLFLRCMHSELDFNSFLTDDVFYPNVMSGIEIGGEKKDYHCIVKTINEKNPPLESLRSLMEKVDGIICGELHEPSFLTFLHEFDLPLVLVSPSAETRNTDAVLIDNFNGSLIATEHLIDKGHRDIAFVGGSVNSLPARERKLGFLKAMERAGLPVDRDRIIDTNWLQSDGYHVFEKLHQESKLPTGIVAASDLLALGLCNGAREKGYKVPADISIIGFDGIFTARQYKPALTTMHVRAMAMGETAFRLFYEQLNGQREYPLKIAIPTEFISGESVASV